MKMLKKTVYLFCLGLSWFHQLWGRPFYNAGYRLNSFNEVKVIFSEAVDSIPVVMLPIINSPVDSLSVEQC